METYNVIHLSVTREHPSLWGDHLADLVVHFKDADDSDLVFIDFCMDIHSNGPCTDSRLRLTTEFDGRPCWTDLTLY